MKRALCAIGWTLLVYTGMAQSMPPKISKVEGSCANGNDHFVMTIHHDRFTDTKHASMGLYVYEGPLGNGWIRSKVNLDQARSFVCKETRTRWLPDDSTPIDE